MEPRPPLPFFMTEPNIWLKERNSGDKYDERDYMRQLYPKQAKQYLAVIYRILDRMDYRDSWLYDEYPDQSALLRLGDLIMAHLPEEKHLSRENQKNLLLILLYDEILRRRQKRNQRDDRSGIFRLSADGKQFKLDGRM